MCEQGGKGVAEHTRGWHEECDFLSSEASRWHRKQLGWRGVRGGGPPTPPPPCRVSPAGGLTDSLYLRSRN